MTSFSSQPPIPRLPEILLGLVNDVLFAFRVESDGRQTLEWSNNGLEKLTGFTEAEMEAGGGWLGLVHEDDRDRVTQAYAETVAGRSSRLEFRLRTRTGGLRPVSLNLSAVRDDDGRVTHVCGAAQDLSAREQAAEAVASRERLLREVLDALPLGVWTVDRDGRVQDVNAAGRRIWGGSYAGVPNDGDFAAYDVRVAGTREAVTAASSAVARVLQSGEPTVDREVEITTPDGTARTVLSTVLPMHDADGAIAGAICINADITERKRLEVQLQQALRMESIGRMAGGIAHDFNNLLTIIVGCAEMALKFDAHGASVTEWEETLAAARRAAELTSQLLAFARQQPVTPRIVNLGVVVGKMQGLLRRVIGADIALSVEAVDGPLTVSIDSGQFEQIVLNLAANARDAMPQGGALRVETRPHVVSEREARRHPGLTPGPKVRLSVADTGVGVPDTIKARIFEPFFTTKAPGAGTGLGLAMCYGIVKQAGGYIGVDSAPGSGATFWIYLPHVQGEESVEAPPATFSERSGDARVLLVEDEPAVAELTRRALKMGGYDVTVVHSGADALAALDKMPVPPDLLLTDVVMPGMRGTVLAKLVTERYPSMPVMFVSGYPGPLDAEFASARLLPKPFKPTELLRMVGEAIHR